MIKTFKFNRDIKAINSKLPKRFEVTKAMRTIGNYQVERIILLDRDRVIGELNKDDTVMLEYNENGRDINAKILKAK